MLKAKELQEHSSEDLQAQYEELSKEIFQLMNELKTSRKLDHPDQLKKKKKDRARILTVLRQKQSQKQA